jgi:hypothetical protein
LAGAALVAGVPSAGAEVSGVDAVVSGVEATVSSVFFDESFEAVSASFLPGTG